MTLSPPAGVWSRRGTLLVLVVVLGPAAAGIALADGGRAADLLLLARDVVVGTGALAAAVLLAGHARLAGNQHSSVLSGCLGVVAAVSLVGGGARLAGAATAAAHRATPLAVATLVTLGLLVVLAAARRSGPLLPLVLAAVLAAAALVAQHAALTGPPPVGTGLLPVVALLFCVLSVALADDFRWLDALPHWARARSAVAVLAWALSVVLAAVPGPPGVPAAPVVAAAGAAVLGAVLVATTAGALLSGLLTDVQRQLTDLRRRLAAAERDRRTDSARLHDVNSLVAGVASAQRLIDDLPPSSHRDGLQVMVRAELDRLQRLLADRRPAAGPAGPALRVHEVLTRVALSHRARGRVVTTPPADPRLQVRGHADDLVQLLDILVDNAAAHGTPADIALGVRRVDGIVEISVTDSGPGVPLDLQGSLFEWGCRGPGSPGSGIGLVTARALATRLGGRLALAPTSVGARFVLALPAPGEQAHPTAQEDRTLAPH